jgi:preprotein translocase subunit SecG
MAAVVLVVHLLLATALIGVVLIQRSEGGALGGLGGGTFGGMMTGRGTANLLTRATAILAGCIIATSLVLALMASGARQPSTILDLPPGPPAPSQPAAPSPAVPAPEAPSAPPSQTPGSAAPAAPAVPAAPAQPSAPLAQ